ncbi:TPA: hypothetical protein ACH3X3_004079 [Trebouxia sp. C0006]
MLLSIQRLQSSVLLGLLFLIGIYTASAQLFPVTAPYFYSATQNAQTCQEVCTYGGVTNMTNYYFTGFYSSQATSLCALDINGSWVPGSQPAGQTDCSVVIENSGATSDGMACACINTNNSPGLASPIGYSTCSDACYDSPYGQGASIPASGSDTTDAYGCIASNNVGISNAFGNVVIDPVSNNATCLTASLTGGTATQSSSYSCTCVFPTSFRRKLKLHRKDITGLASLA